MTEGNPSVFVAWRDLRFARGRFALIAAVVALITFLVGFLAGLTAGLASQNISAVLELPGSRIVLQEPTQGQAEFSNSSISPAVVQQWRQTPGVTQVSTVGITQGRATNQGASDQGSSVAVALFGLGKSDEATSLTELAPATGDEIGLSSAAAKQLDVSEGGQVTIAGSTFKIASVGADLWYSHTPAVVLTPAAWSTVDKSTGGTGEPTALGVSGQADWDVETGATHTKAFTQLTSLSALETFKSEVGSLGLMIAMLFGVSALVVGAFFTVWTMQRAGDVAVLKALGATTGSLIRDALGQAMTVLLVGIVIGLAAVVGLSLLVSNALPFFLSPLTTLAPAAVMALLGLAGALFALRSVTHADPLTALGSNR